MRRRKAKKTEVDVNQNGVSGIGQSESNVHAVLHEDDTVGEDAALLPEANMWVTAEDYVIASEDDDPLNKAAYSGNNNGRKRSRPTDDGTSEGTASNNTRGAVGLMDAALLGHHQKAAKQQRAKHKDAHTFAYPLGAYEPDWCQAIGGPSGRVHTRWLHLPRPMQADNAAALLYSANLTAHRPNLLSDRLPRAMPSPCARAAIIVDASRFDDLKDLFIDDYGMWCSSATHYTGYFVDGGGRQLRLARLADKRAANRMFETYTADQLADIRFDFVVRRERRVNRTNSSLVKMAYLLCWRREYIDFKIQMQQAPKTRALHCRYALAMLEYEWQDGCPRPLLPAAHKRRRRFQPLVRMRNSEKCATQTSIGRLQHVDDSPTPDVPELNWCSFGLRTLNVNAALDCFFALSRGSVDGEQEGGGVCEYLTVWPNHRDVQLLLNISPGQLPEFGSRVLLLNHTLLESDLDILSSVRGSILSERVFSIDKSGELKRQVYSGVPVNVSVEHAINNGLPFDCALRLQLINTKYSQVICNSYQWLICDPDPSAKTMCCAYEMLEFSLYQPIPVTMTPKRKTTTLSPVAAADTSTAPETTIPTYALVRIDNGTATAAILNVDVHNQHGTKSWRSMINSLQSMIGTVSERQPNQMVLYSFDNYLAQASTQLVPVKQLLDSVQLDTTTTPMTTTMVAGSNERIMHNRSAVKTEVVASAEDEDEELIATTISAAGGSEQQQHQQLNPIPSPLDTPFDARQLELIKQTAIRDDRDDVVWLQHRPWTLLVPAGLLYGVSVSASLDSLVSGAYPMWMPDGLGDVAVVVRCHTIHQLPEDAYGVWSPLMINSDWTRQFDAQYLDYAFRVDADSGEVWSCGQSALGGSDAMPPLDFVLRCYRPLKCTQVPFLVKQSYRFILPAAYTPTKDEEVEGGTSLMCIRYYYRAHKTGRQQPPAPPPPIAIEPNFDQDELSLSKPEEAESVLCNTEQDADGCIWLRRDSPFNVASAAVCLYTAETEPAQLCTPTAAVPVCLPRAHRRGAFIVRVSSGAQGVMLEPNRWQLLDAYNVKTEWCGGDMRRLCDAPFVVGANGECTRVLQPANLNQLSTRLQLSQVKFDFVVRHCRIRHRAFETSAGGLIKSIYRIAGREAYINAYSDQFHNVLDEGIWRLALVEWQWSRAPVHPSPVVQSSALQLRQHALRQAGRHGRQPPTAALNASAASCFTIFATDEVLERTADGCTWLCAPVRLQPDACAFYLSLAVHQPNMLTQLLPGRLPPGWSSAAYIAHLPQHMTGSSGCDVAWPEDAYGDWTDQQQQLIAYQLDRTTGAVNRLCRLERLESLTALRALAFDVVLRRRCQQNRTCPALYREHYQLATRDDYVAYREQSSDGLSPFALQLVHYKWTAPIVEFVVPPQHNRLQATHVQPGIGQLVLIEEQIDK